MEVDPNFLGHDPSADRAIDGLVGEIQRLEARVQELEQQLHQAHADVAFITNRVRAALVLPGRQEPR